MSVVLKRIYAPPARDDGIRILVDRVWPRGISRTDAALDDWLKEVAPSTELRRWFGHKPERWQEFQRRYRAELKTNPALKQLRALARHTHVTLLYGARDTEHNQAQVLRTLLGRPAKPPAYSSSARKPSARSRSKSA